MARALAREKISEALSSMPLVFIGILLIALLLGIALGITGSYGLATVIGAGSMVIMLVLRQDEWAVIVILMLHLYVDWYLGMHGIALVLTCILLGIFFLERCAQYPWSKPRALWLWGVFLLLAIYPALQGALTWYDATYYYPNIIVGALLMFWIGTVIARDMTHVRRFFKILALVGTLLAIITIIQNKTGVLLFGSSRFDTYLVSVSDFNVFQGSDDYRLGSFFINPDWNGAFFAMMFCIPLSLFVESDVFSAKLLYMVEALIILPALLFTYSIGAWISAIVGIIIFFVLVGRTSYRLWIFVFLLLAALTLSIGFPDQIALLFQHASNPTVLTLRQGAWKTAINVIRVFPLTGIGMGLQAYILRAEPYRVPEQYRTLAHPHNSYLELGAMAGLPVLLVFVALVLIGLWWALRNWKRADMRQRSLLSAGIAGVITLSVNSMSVNAWSLPPLAAPGWLLLGIVSSPLLMKSEEAKKEITTRKGQL